MNEELSRASRSEIPPTPPTTPTQPRLPANQRQETEQHAAGGIDERSRSKVKDHNHKLLEITTKNPQLCGIAISGAGGVGEG